ncbi:MAG TPA: hypothetical protein VF661_08340 [Actinomycetales bacterium]
MTDAAGVEIAGRGVRRTVVTAGSVSVATFVIVAARGHVVLELLTVPALCLLSVALHRGDTVVLGDDALVARTRQGERVFAWADVLEMSWWGGRWWQFGGGPVLRVRGGAWDVPGPNAAALVAKVPLFAGGASDAAARAVRAAAERHGVPWTDSPEKMDGAPAQTRTTARRPAASVVRGAAPPVTPSTTDGTLPSSPFQTRRSRQVARREQADNR